LKNKWIIKSGNEYTIAAGVEVTDTMQQTLQTLANGNFAKEAIDDKVRTDFHLSYPYLRIADTQPTFFVSIIYLFRLVRY
jgi:hypothetical protein